MKLWQQWEAAATIHQERAATLELQCNLLTEELAAANERYRKAVYQISVLQDRMADLRSVHSDLVTTIALALESHR